MKNKKTLKFSLSGILVIAVLLISTSCATLSQPDDAAALQIVELINTGDSGALKAMSADTVLFDSEILHGPVLIGTLWDGMASSGFTLKNAEVVEKKTVEVSDAVDFGAGPGTEVFFSQYIPDSSVLFRISSAGGSVLLILGPAQDGSAQILAFGGPY